MIFQTERLTVKPIQPTHKNEFIELLCANEVITAIPQEKPSIEEVYKKFEEAVNFNGNILNNNRSLLGVFLHDDDDEMIGLVAFLTNDEQDKEIGYRFRKKYWGKGYATEITQGMITYAFSELQIPKITADVWVENKASERVLKKFFTPVKEFYNSKDNCTDKRYELLKEDWDLC